MKVFDAQPCGNLAADDAIGTGGENAQEDNLKLLHRQRVLTPNETEVSYGDRGRVWLARKRH